MATYYVALDGDDSISPAQAQNSNDNSTGSSPWASLIQALYVSEALAFGDELVLQANSGQTTAVFNGSGGIWKTGLAARYIPPVLGAGTGHLTIRAAVGHDITIDMPTDAATRVLLLDGKFKFQNIKLRNTNSTTNYFAEIRSIAALGDFLFDGGDIDNNNVNGNLISISTLTTGYDIGLTLRRTKVRNFGSATNGLIKSAIDPTNKVKRFKLTCEVCDIADGKLLLHGNGITAGPMDFECINSSVDTGQILTIGLTDNSVVTVKNNTLNCRIKATTSTPANWDIKNNVVFNPVTADPGSELDQIFWSDFHIIPVDESNTYIADMGFSSGCIIGTGSMAAQRGSSAYLPAGGDFNGAEWSGNDVGPYANPSATTPPAMIPGTIAFVGDSIAEGIGVNYATNGVMEKTSVGTGVLGVAIGGCGGQSAKYLVDRAAVEWRPQYMVFSLYHNNMFYDHYTPSAMTIQEAVDDTEIAMIKAEAWGITPIFLGMAGVIAATEENQTTKPIAFNEAMRSVCTAHGWPFRSIIEWMIKNPNWNLATTSGGYYQAGGLAVEVHPAAAGYDFICKILRQLFIITSRASVGSIGRAKYNYTVVDAVPESLGNNICVDPSFDNSASWPLLGNNGSVSGGQALLPNNSAFVRQNNALAQIGEWEIVIDIASNTNEVWFYFNQAVAGKAVFTGNGIQTQRVTSTGTPTQLTVLSNGGAAIINSISVRKVTAAINATYTWPENANQLIEHAHELYSGTTPITFDGWDAVKAVANDTNLFVGDKGAAAYSIDMSAKADKIKKILADTD